MGLGFVENEEYLIRPVRDDDKELFLRIHQENSELSAAYDDKKFRDFYWEEKRRSKGDILMLAFSKWSEECVANCYYQDSDTDIVEIGINVDRPFQNMGIGTKLLLLLVDDLKMNAPDKRICIKTKSNNLQCQRMIEKAGGIKIAEEPTEFDRITMTMIPKLDALGLVEEAQRDREAMDCNHGINLFVYDLSGSRMTGEGSDG